MRRFRLILFAAAFGALLGGAAPALAQAPSVGFVFPPGGPAGARAAVTVQGGNLQGATAVLVSGEGVRAAIARNSEAGSLPLELEIAPDALPGLRELRVVTPRGVSNAGRIWIGSYPEVAEAEPNNTLAQPQKLDRLPVTLNGQINGGEDVDQFVFQAGAGETFVFDLVATRIASGLDGYLLLTDRRGKQLAYAQEGFDRDPRLIHTFETAGEYVLQVRDSMYRGGANFVYRLTMGRLPVVTGYLPVGGRRGETVRVALEGYNLGGMKSMDIAIPAAAEEVTVVPQTPAGPAVAPVTLHAGAAEERVETEPNDDPARATPAPEGPVVLNGRIDREGDVDYFRLKPSAAGTVRLELFGRRIGSRIDSLVRVLDASGKQLAINDDAVGKDSRLDVGLQANTEYLVEVRNQHHRFGGDVYYRLEIDRPDPPDFRLTVTPTEVNLDQGGSAAVTVNVQRIGGFNGPVALRVEGLPEGVATSYATIPAGANSLAITLTAPASLAPGAVASVRIVGTASVNGQELQRAAQPVETYRPPLAQENQTAQRPVLLFPMCITPPAPFALDLEPRQLTVKRGTQGVQIKLRAVRQMGQNGEIKLAVSGLPQNVAAETPSIPANGGEVVVKLNVPGNAPVGTTNLIVTGTLGNANQVAPALTLTITE